MKRLFALLPLLASVLLLGAADPGLVALERVAEASATLQPGLNHYQCRVTSSKMNELLAQMTAAMPADMPRPPLPAIRRYWVRSPRLVVIRAEDGQVLPYMQQMVQRFSTAFALDPLAVLLPPSAAARRAALLQQAKVKVAESRLDQMRTQTIHIKFPAPVDLDGAFYGGGLELPQKQVASLVFDLDPDKQTVERLEIVSATGKRLLAEPRYRQTSGGYLMEELRTTSPDGQIDDHLQTSFAKVDGFLLPVRQVRTVRRPQRQETITVSFSEFRLNAPLPGDLAPPGETP